MLSKNKNRAHFYLRDQNYSMASIIRDQQASKKAAEQRTPSPYAVEMGIVLKPFSYLLLFPAHWINKIISDVSLSKVGLLPSHERR